MHTNLVFGRGVGRCARLSLSVANMRVLLSTVFLGIITASMALRVQRRARLAAMKEAMTKAAATIFNSKKAEADGAKAHLSWDALPAP